MIRIKTKEQLDGIRKACRLLSEVLVELSADVRAGVTTLELDERARLLIESQGGRPAFLGFGGFPGSLCTSVNEAVIHGIPDERPLVEGDIISIDCGIILDGYISDSAVTVPVGSIEKEVERLLDVTRESLYLGIDAARVGGRVADISKAVYKHTHGQGYGVVREYCGHGVGLELHEDPQVPNYPSRGPNPRLKPGMVIAIEPMITLGRGDIEVLDDDWTVVTGDGSPAAHFEHTVAITEAGPEILTMPEGQSLSTILSAIKESA